MEKPSENSSESKIVRTNFENYIFPTECDDSGLTFRMRENGREIYTKPI